MQYFKWFVQCIWQDLPGWWVLLALLFLTAENNSAQAQNELFGQFRQKFTSPSPDASMLSKNGNYPVALHNGLVDVTIPITEAKSGELLIPVSLKYHMGGIKVNDVSSVAGLQWSLQAAPSITRVINGLPDETGMLLNPVCGPERPGEYFPCYLYNLSKDVPVADAMRDLFQFNLPARSGKFVLKDIDGSGAPQKVMTIPYAPIRISTSDFKSFTITENDGTLMVFGQPEYTSTSSVVAQPTAWYLTSMISADKSDTITLKYNTAVPVVTALRTTILAERIDPAATLSSRLSYSNHGTTITHNMVTLQEINFSNGKIRFDYLADRIDLAGAPRLNFIELYAKRKPGTYERIRRFNFFHSYFTAASGQTSEINGMLPGPLTSYSNRLRLDKIVQQGFSDGLTKTLPPYVFEYENGAFPLLGSTAQDYLGHYNGAHANSNLLFYGTGFVNGIEILARQFGANRSIVPDYLRAGMLKRIRYPGGSYTDFESEPNQIDVATVDSAFTYNEYAQVLTSRDRTKSELIFSVTAEMTEGNNDCLADLSLSLFNNLTNEVPITTTVALLDQTTGKYALILPDQNQFPAYTGNAVFNWNDQIKAINNVYRVQLLKGHSYKFSYTNSFSTTANYFYASVKWRSVRSLVTTPVSKTILTGGMRIKSITNFDGAGAYLKKRYVYNKGYFNSNLFKGDAGYIAEILRTRVKRWFGSDPAAPMSGNFFWYNIYGTTVSMPISASSGSVASYAEVEELIVDEANRSLGKTVYQFRTAQDYVPAMLPFFKMDADWKRSQLERKKVYRTSETGALLLSEEWNNVYQDYRIDSVRNLVSLLSEDGTSPVLSPYFEQCPGNLKNGNIFRWMDFFQMSFQSVCTRVNSSSYDQTGTRAISQEKNYTYRIGSDGNLILVTDQTSDGREKTTRYVYPGDFKRTTCDASNCDSGYLSAVQSQLALRNSCEQNNYTVYSSTGQSVYFNAYRNCATDFQTQLSTKIIPAYQSCRADYLSCLGNAISSAASPDKAILVMQRDNHIGKVMENASGIIQNGVEYITNGSRNDYQLNNSGLVRPAATYSFFANKPVERSLNQLQGSGLFQTIVSIDQTDRFGNILQATGQNDLTRSWLWDYNGTLPVAQIINAPVSEVAYSSFESESAGNFLSISYAFRNGSDARTGRYSYELSGGALVKSGLNISKTYTVSFWSKTGAVVSVNKSAVPASDVVVKDWKYIELQISGVTTISLSGSGLIDEVRIYPSGSQLETFTYDPLIGLTSKTDMNGQTDFFEYDPLGRLKVVRDNKRNIKKAYQYNLKP